MAPGHGFQVFLRVTVQNQVRIAQRVIVSQFVFKGMSIADIAEKSGVSRQAINRKKLSILKKLECAFFPKTSK